MIILPICPCNIVATPENKFVVHTPPTIIIRVKYLQYCGLEYPLSVDVRFGVPTTGRHSDDALGVSDNAMPRLDVGPVELKALGVTLGLVLSLTTHFRHVRMDPVPFGVHHFHTI